MTTSTCLVSSALVVGPDDWSEFPMCGMAITEHTIPAAGSIEDGFLVGTLSAGEYVLTVNFGGGESETQDFVVVP